MHRKTIQNRAHGNYSEKLGVLKSIEMLCCKNKNLCAMCFLLFDICLMYPSGTKQSKKRPSHTNRQRTLNSNHHSFAYHNDNNENDITTCGNDYIIKPSIGNRLYTTSIF